MNFAGSRLWRGKQQLWVYVIAGLLAGDFVLCGYIPSRERLKSLQQARAEQLRTIAMAAGQGEELAALKLRLRTAQKMVERYEACVPTEGTLGTFLQQMTGLMTEHCLTDQAVVPGKDRDADGVTCIPIQMTCRGTLVDMFGFFRDLQALDRLVRIENVTLKNDAEFNGKISMHADTAIFYRPAMPRKTRSVAGVKPGGGSSDGS